MIFIGTVLGSYILGKQVTTGDKTYLACMYVPECSHEQGLGFSVSDRKNTVKPGFPLFKEKNMG